MNGGNGSYEAGTHTAGGGGGGASAVGTAAPANGGPTTSGAGGMIDVEDSDNIFTVDGI
jgi:hypothetical protein